MADIIRAADVFIEEGPLVEPEVEEELIFVGDTHGDYQTSEKIIEEYLKPENVLVFLGDYVDKGRYSKENIDYLLKQKLKNKKNLYLLQGNHEGWQYVKFWPRNFWESFDLEEDKKMYSFVLSQMPLALSWRKIIALHSGLPEVESL